MSIAAHLRPTSVFVTRQSEQPVLYSTLPYVLPLLTEQLDNGHRRRVGDVDDAGSALWNDNDQSRGCCVLRASSKPVEFFLK